MGDSSQILALTRAMLQAAEAGDWDKVQAMECQRRSLLEQPPGDESRCRRGAGEAGELEEAVRLNGLLIDLGARARADAEEALALLRRGRKANLAYNGMK